MQKYTYITYQLGINLSEKEVKSPKGAEKLKREIEGAINDFSAKGYEFHNQITMPVTVNPGCLGSLLGSKSQQINVPVLVFRKEVEDMV